MAIGIAALLLLALGAFAVLAVLEKVDDWFLSRRLTVVSVAAPSWDGERPGPEAE